MDGLKVDDIKSTESSGSALLCLQYARILHAPIVELAPHLANISIELEQNNLGSNGGLVELLLQDFLQSPRAPPVFVQNLPQAY
jgi:hypothetical protein